MKFFIMGLMLCFCANNLFAQEDTIKKNSVKLNDTLSIAIQSDTLKTLIPDTTTVSIGTASFYHQKFNGRKTSSGEIFNNDNLTAAHKTLKLGTYVKVRCLKNDSTVIVKINDRLPPNSKRIIDLTTRAAKQLNFIQSGLTKVEITVLSKETPIIKKKNNEKHSHKKRNHRKR